MEKTSSSPNMHILFSSNNQDFSNVCLTVPLFCRNFIGLESYRKISYEALWPIELKLIIPIGMFSLHNFLENSKHLHQPHVFPSFEESNTKCLFISPFLSLIKNSRSCGTPPGWIFGNMDLCVHRLPFLIAFRVKSVLDLWTKSFREVAELKVQPKNATCTASICVHYTQDTNNHWLIGQRGVLVARSK